MELSATFLFSSKVSISIRNGKEPTVSYLACLFCYAWFGSCFLLLFLLAYGAILHQSAYKWGGSESTHFPHLLTHPCCLLVWRIWLPKNSELVECNLTCKGRYLWLSTSFMAIHSKDKCLPQMPFLLWRISFFKK